MGQRASALAIAATALFAVSIAGASTLAGPSFTEAGQFGQTQLARGITTAPDGTVYVADTNNARIAKFTATGGAQGTFGSFGTAPGKFSSPEDIDVASDGNVWVADYNNSRLQELRPDGSSVRVISQGQLLAPGVAVDAAGNVWSTRIGGNGAGTVQKFDKGSNYAPTTSWGGLNYPHDIEVSPDGSIYVAVEGQGRRVVRYDATGKQLATIPAGSSNPLGIAVDLDCNVWVGDIGNRRIQKYSPSGKLLGELKPKTETIANDIAVGPTGTLYISNGGRSVLRLTEDKKPGVAAVPGRIVATKSGNTVVAKVKYAVTGIACPDEVGATASIAGKGIAGKAAGLKLPIGKVSTIEIPLKGKALLQKGRTVPATFSIVLQKNGRAMAETKKVVVGIPK